jgi:hypothetical protein
MRHLFGAVTVTPVVACLSGLFLTGTPAFAQIDIAAAMAPHLVDGQVVFLPPGTFGSYAMTRRDLTGNNGDLRAMCGRLLATQPLTGLELTLPALESADLSSPLDVPAFLRRPS